MTSRPLPLLSTIVIASAVLTGCGGSSAGGGSDSAGQAIAVTATDVDCTLDVSTVASGPTTFNVSNTGSEVTEVYVYAKSDEGQFSTIVAEVENIGPGTSRDMSADLGGGTYEVACKPGQTGDGIRTTLTVEGEATAGSPSASESASAREIELSITDQGLSGPSGLSGTTGERIEFAVVNNAADGRVFEVKRPDGSVAGETEIAAGTEGELYVDLADAGDWLLIVEGGDKPTESAFTVS
jgi:iron uptake system component EfeO